MTFFCSKDDGSCLWLGTKHCRNWSNCWLPVYSAKPAVFSLKHVIRLLWFLKNWGQILVRGEEGGGIKIPHAQPLSLTGRLAQLVERRTREHNVSGLYRCGFESPAGQLKLLIVFR